MTTPLKRKIIAVSPEAFEHLLKIRNAQAKAMNFRLVTLTDCATNLILSIPIPNGSKPEGEPKEENENG